MTGRRDPSQLTLEDLDLAAEEMKEIYFNGAWISYLTCVFPNAEYVQPGTAEKKADSRRAYTDRVLYAHRARPDEDAKGKRCFLSGEPATHLINRAQMPLITGAAVLNFFPGSSGGFPIAGPYLTALQALPFGGRRAEGRILLVHADSPELTLTFARQYVRDNRKLISLASAAMGWDGPHPELDRAQAKKEKMPQVRFPRTLVVRDLMSAMLEQELEIEDSGFGSVTAYWLSNSGQGASLDLFDIPANLVSLFRRLGSPSLNYSWRRLLQSGWLRQKPVNPKNPAEPELPARAGRSRNAVLEDLLQVYSGGSLDLRAGSRFVRRHLAGLLYLRDTSYRMPDWPLITVFMEEFFGMSPKRIEMIKDFADKLIASIERSGKKKLIIELSYVRKAWEFRNLLLKELRRDFTQHNDLLFTFEQYLGLFEDDDGAGLADWGLTRDLLMIRLFQLSHERKLELKEFAAELENAESGDRDTRQLVGATADDEA